MRLAVVVNDLGSLSEAQSTWQWMAHLRERGCDVQVLEADALDVLPDGRVHARARALPRTLSALRASPAARVDLHAVDAVLVRTNPGRDPRPWATSVLLQQLQQLQEAGVVVINDPVGLQRAASKLYLSALPEDARPRTLVTRDVAEARAFVGSLGGPAIMKPLRGTRGQDVFRLAGPDEPNLAQIADVVMREGPAMVQAFVPEARSGDMRVHLVEGRLLEVDGVAACVRRVPGGSDFRSNVHVGGTPAPGARSPAIDRLVALVGPKVVADGLFHVGLDVIGGVIVEINVFSPGGFEDLRRFSGVDFLEVLSDRLLAHLAARRTPTR